MEELGFASQKSAYQLEATITKLERMIIGLEHDDSPLCFLPPGLSAMLSCLSLPIQSQPQPQVFTCSAGKHCRVIQVPLPSGDIYLTRSDSLSPNAINKTKKKQKNKGATQNRRVCTEIMPSFHPGL